MSVLISVDRKEDETNYPRPVAVKHGKIKIYESFALTIRRLCKIINTNFRVPRSNSKKVSYWGGRESRDAILWAIRKFYDLHRCI
jgi:hypothetical protein